MNLGEKKKMLDIIKSGEKINAMTQDMICLYQIFGGSYLGFFFRKWNSKAGADLLVPNISNIDTNRILEIEFGILLMFKIICLQVNGLRTRDLGWLLQGTGEPER